MPITPDIDIVKQHWSKVDHSVSEKNFYRFPVIRARSCQLIFNETDATRSDWHEYWTVEKHLKNDMPFEKRLSFCCGFGHVERSLAKLDVAKKIVGTDIAAGAVEEARRRARAENLDNIEYYVSDMNHERLPHDEYDLIYANGALHHIANLESVIPIIYNAVRPGGYLVANEYVGPRYKQIGTRQQEFVNAVKPLLPPELRTRIVRPIPYGLSIVARAIRYARRKLEGVVCNQQVYGALWWRLTVAQYIATHPSECVRSDKIIPTLKQHFDEVEVRFYNGSILCYALDPEFYNNVDIRNKNHQVILQMLFHIEDALAATGEIGQDNAFMVCKKGKRGACG